jgi:hypothetical protein
MYELLESLQPSSQCSVDRIAWCWHYSRWADSDNCAIAPAHVALNLHVVANNLGVHCDRNFFAVILFPELRIGSEHKRIVGRPT